MEADSTSSARINQSRPHRLHFLEGVTNTTKFGPAPVDFARTMMKETDADTMQRYDRLLSREIAMEQKHSSLQRREADLARKELEMSGKQSEMDLEKGRLEVLKDTLQGDHEKRIEEAKAQDKEVIRELTAALDARTNENTKLQRDMRGSKALEAETDRMNKSLADEKRELESKLNVKADTIAKMQMAAVDSRVENEILGKENEVQDNAISNLRRDKLELERKNETQRVELESHREIHLKMHEALQPLLADAEKPNKKRPMAQELRNPGSQKRQSQPVRSGKSCATEYVSHQQAIGRRCSN